MTIEAAKLYVQRHSMYGNENAPVGSSARSHFESELISFIDGYNKAIDDALELYYNPTSLEEQDSFDRDLESLKI